MRPLPAFKPNARTTRNDRIMKSKLLLSAVLANLSLASLVAGDLEPLMSQPDKVVLREDFSKSKKLDKAVWRARQGTRWAMEDGVLRGRPSSPEYQARKADHKGLEPRLSIPAAPQEFIIEFSIRIVGGDPDRAVRRVWPSCGPGELEQGRRAPVGERRIGSTCRGA